MMLTLAEAAEQLRLSERFLREEIYRGRLKAMKAGAARNAPIRISEDAIRDYLKLSAVKPVTR
jgi:excisionase family DNA binding protein